jgi:hypothetical protein
LWNYSLTLLFIYCDYYGVKCRMLRRKSGASPTGRNKGELARQ